MTASSPSSSPIVAWLEVSVTVDAPWAELVAEALGVPPCSPAELTVAEAPSSPPGPNPAEAARHAYAASSRRTIRTWVDARLDVGSLRQQIRARLAALVPILGPTAEDDLVPRFTSLDARASSAFAGRPWRAFRVGRVCIGPPEDARVRRATDVFLALLPGQAFGTGRHATTRQCLAALQAHLRPGQRVLDAGCGTGLLGVAAARLGASAVTLLDCDPIAVDCARQLAATHRVADRCAFVVDDAAQIPDGPWDGILANLEPGLARRFAESYARALVPGGWLVASGCPRADADDLREALLAAGLVPTRLHETPRWCTWIARRPADAFDRSIPRPDRSRTMSDAPPSRWTDALAHDALPAGGMHPVRVGGQDVLLVRDAGGALHGVEARCPHEGYPLATGKLDGCVLTCAWHNWKFDVGDGSCRLGGEGLRTYPVRVVGERIEVDVAEPDGSARIPALGESLDAALHDGDAARALRDGTRLLLAGLDPVHLLGRIARHDALHAEYGTTHTLPVAADLATLLPRFAGPRAMIAVAPAIESCIEANMRLPVRERAEAVEGASFERLAEAVEREDAVLAEGLLRGALRDGVPHAEIDGWMLRLQCAHFTDFGHPLIYTIKALELLPHLPADARDDLHPALLYGLVLATREDTLPYWSRSTRRLDDVAARFAEWSAGARADAPFDGSGLRDAIVDGSHGEALDALVGALAAGVDATRIARVLVIAAAHRLLRFDVALDRDPDVAEGWLWATHRFTFASAVRHATERLEHPDVLRLLFQSLAFTHSGRPMDVSPDARTSLAPLPVDEVSEIVSAVTAKDAHLACGRLAGWLAAGRPLQPVADALLELCVSDPAVRPIVVAHVLKTTRAALDEHAALVDHPDRDVPLFAAVRFLASPVVERRVRASAEAAVAWVAERRMPRKLTQ